MEHDDERGLFTAFNNNYSNLFTYLFIYGLVDYLLKMKG
jgi:hypothetical protein